MQELVLLLSSIAGACTAAAAKKFPKAKLEIPSIGANAHIKEQVNSLRIEKDILTKTIARLYQQEMSLTKIQRDRLLLRYQHQLGVVLAKIEKLEVASKHPDLGPLGDGLITLMDKKLSQLDQRLFELSSRIAVSSVQVPEIKKENVPSKEEKSVKQKQKIEENIVSEPIQEKQIVENKIPPVEIQVSKPQKPLELTTLTEIPTKPFSFPWIEQKPLAQIEIDEVEEQKVQPKPEIVIAPKQETVVEVPKKTIDPKEIAEIQEKLEDHKKLLPQLPSPQNIPSSQEKSKPVTDDVDDDEDDLAKIKSEILKTLSKLEQAEVE